MRTLLSFDSTYKINLEGELEQAIFFLDTNAKQLLLHGLQSAALHLVEILHVSDRDGADAFEGQVNVYYRELSYMLSDAMDLANLKALRNSSRSSLRKWDRLMWPLRVRDYL